MRPVKINIQATEAIIYSLAAIAKIFFEALVANFTKTITFQEVIKWFQEHQNLKLAKKDNLAFTLLNVNQNGQYVICQGIFNQHQGEIIAGEKIQGQKIDPELLAVHQGKLLAIYE